MLAYHGPIAQLGERFNGIEEVKGSSPFRSIEAHSHLNCISQPPRPHITTQYWFIGGFCFHTAAADGLSVVQMRKGRIVAKQKQSPLDRLSNGLREIVDAVDRLLNPPQPKRAPVPVPVRVPRPQDRRNPYGRY